MKEFDTLCQLAISAVYEATLKDGIDPKVFIAIKNRGNQRFENYRANGGKCLKQRDRPETTFKRLLNLCAEREVEIYTHYDFILRLYYRNYRNAKKESHHRNGHNKEYGSLRQLRTTLNDILTYKPADSGNEEEDNIWNQTDYLFFELLNDFFEETTHDNN